MTDGVTEELTAKSFTDWAKTTENYSRGPEFLPDDSPWGPINFDCDEGRDRDRPSTYYSIVEVNGRFFRYEADYDSWEGVMWENNYDGYEEVAKMTRAEEYWGNV